MNKNYIILNNKVNQKDKNGNYTNLELDKQAVREYFLNNVNQNTVFFHSLEEKLDYLVENGYYDKKVLDKYTIEEIKEVFKLAYSKKFRFRSYLGAFMFYDRYALRTTDKERILERYEDRLSMIALTVGRNVDEAKEFLNILINRQLQPATPIYMNSGKLRAGNMVSCFILSLNDDLESIGYTFNSIMKLSQLGGGVGIVGTDIRARGETIKGIENSASGILPPAKVMEDLFSYVNQLNLRSGSGSLNLSIFHNDIQELINSKKVNADEKLRLKTLSICIVIPDKFMEILKDNSTKYYYTFYPKNIYDVYGIELSQLNMSEWYDKLLEDKRIKKTQRNKLQILQEIIRTQAESGYPYIMFEDNVNKENNLREIGKIVGTNICVEISQIMTKNNISQNPYIEKNEFGYDVNCVLSSLNLVELFNYKSDYERKNIIISSIKFLSNVSDLINIESVPSVKKANDELHSVGLGVMNLQGLFVKNGIDYESEEAKDLTNAIFNYIRYYSLYASMEIAKERGKFVGFEKSDYASGKALEKYINGTVDLEVKTDKVKELLYNMNILIPTVDEWKKLNEYIMKYGIYNAYQMAIAPNQSSAYIMEATPSVQPVSNIVEVRDYGYSQAIYPMPYLTNENKHLYKNAYEVDQLKMLDLMAVIQQYVDQAISIVVNVKSDTTLKERAKIITYAWQKGIKSLYYWRTQKQSIMADKEPICESCSV
jgi:ribonucleoside-diphosphate reductase, alpha subunit